jgi:hypothetical protein
MVIGHELTDQDRLKKTGKRNPGTALVNSIKNRVHCNEKCKIFWDCPMMALSLSRENVDNKCLLNAGGNALIRRFINVFAKGEMGLINEINSVLYSYGMDIEVATPSVKKDYATMLMNWHKSLYGDPRKASMEQKPNLTVVINEMDGRGQIKEVEFVPLVESGRINTPGDSAIAAEILKAKHDDPESLLNSSIVDDLFKNLPHPKGSSAEQRNTTQGPGGKFVSLKGVKDGIPEPDNRTENDESARTEGEPEELEKASDSTSGGS